MFAPPIPRQEAAELQRTTASALRLSHSEIEQGHLLQRSVGNQAMIQLLVQRAGLARNEPVAPGKEAATARKSGRTVQPSTQRLSPQSGVSGSVQAKLKIGAVNHPLEREADRVAEQVIGMPVQGDAGTPAPPQISGKSTDEKKEGLLQKPAEHQGAPSEGIVHEVLRSPGQPLDTATRTFFEARFGRDFSGVRVHVNSPEAESARAIDALAYTAGRHIVFGAGTFTPNSVAGRKLLAHELAHTIQQPSQPSATAPGATTTVQRTPSGQAKEIDSPSQVASGERELPWYQHHQLEALEGLIQEWTEDERGIARDLLRKWFELRNAGRGTVSVKKLIQQDLLIRYQYWLQAKDDLVQRYCREHNLGAREMFGGGISCEPLFEGDQQLGYFLIDSLRSNQDQTSPDVAEAPLMTVHRWVLEYRNRTNQDVLKEAGLITNTLTGIAFGLKAPEATPRPPSEPPPPAQKQLPPAGSPGPVAVGDMTKPGAETGLGPQRIVATMPNGDQVSSPVVRQPAPGRALPSSPHPEGPAAPPASTPPAQKQLPPGAPPAAELTQAPRGQRRHVPAPQPKPKPAVSAPPPKATSASPQVQLPKGTYPEGQSGNQTPTRVKPDPATARPTGAPSTRDADIVSQRGMRRQDIAYRSGDQHHVFPQDTKFKAWFDERLKGSEDIHEYTVYLSEGEHQAIHLSGEGGLVKGVKEPDLLGWNQEWMNFMDKNKLASGQQIFEEAGRLMDKYKISYAEIARYRQRKK